MKMSKLKYKSGDLVHVNFFWGLPHTRAEIWEIVQTRKHPIQPYLIVNRCSFSPHGNPRMGWINEGYLSLAEKEKVWEEFRFLFNQNSKKI